MQNMSEHVYYSEPQRILYRLLDSTHITQTIAGNTLVTELPQYSSELVSKRKTQISANGLIYNNLHGNQCNNFHIPDILDFLWNSNVRKRLFPSACPTNGIVGLRIPSMIVLTRPVHIVIGHSCIPFSSKRAKLCFVCKFSCRTCGELSQIFCTFVSKITETLILQSQIKEYKDLHDIKYIARYIWE